MRALPSDLRCALCRAPFGGPGGRVLRHLGFGPSRKNPRLCDTCFEKAPDGGIQMNIGVLFADVRGFTSLAERQGPADMTALLDRFYEASIRVLCRHAIIDKLVGDQVMALYLPQVLGDPADHMVADARELLAATPADLAVGVGLDYGMAFVGNVGSGSVKDFTAIGDVVNTAARLQAAAAGGEVVLSQRVKDLSHDEPPGMRSRVLDLKGKSRPERVFALRPTP